MSKSSIEAPWSVTFHDGSNNQFRFWRESARAQARYEYSPMRPEQSSSGTYSGGEPARGELDSARVERLWQWLERLATDAAIQATARAMGTGAFTIVDRGGQRSFVIEDGEALQGFEEFVGLLRSPDSPPTR